MSEAEVCFEIDLFVRAEFLEDFLAYESEALGRLSIYAGQLRSRIRFEDRLGHAEGIPFERHVVSFESEEKFQAFLDDPVRLRIQSLFDRAVIKVNLKRTVRV